MNRMADDASEGSSFQPRITGLEQNLLVTAVFNCYKCLHSQATMQQDDCFVCSCFLLFLSCWRGDSGRSNAKTNCEERAGRMEGMGRDHEGRDINLQLSDICRKTIITLSKVKILLKDVSQLWLLGGPARPGTPSRRLSCTLKD